MRGKVAIVMAAACLSACAGSIETRTIASGSMPAAGQSFAILSPPAADNGDPAPAHATALVAENLSARGYVQGETPAWLVQVALSDRPASSGIASGEDISIAAKQMRLLQNCQDREYRLSIVFLDAATGARGRAMQAAEYHCKGTLAESLPHLVAAALSRDTGAQFRSGRE